MAKQQAKPNNAPSILNREAKFNYHLSDKYVAGMVLTGSEVKSLRQGKANLKEAYCYFAKGELFVKNMHITPYEQGGYANHTSDRERKLLLNAKELKKLQVATLQKGTTIIPLKLFFNERGLVKLEIAVGVGKKLHDKRETIKQRDTERDMGRKFK